MSNQNGGALPGFHGDRISRGYGVGTFARVAVPLVKLCVNAIGQKATERAINVGRDVLAEKNVKQAVTSRWRQAVNDLAKQGLNNIKKQIGGGQVRPVNL